MIIIIKSRFLIMLKLILLAYALCLVLSAPSADKMNVIPGYPSTYNTSIYAGYLDVKNTNRSLHYVFVESINGANNKDPVTLWLNGGPGCSSLLGFLQQIGPYYLEEGVNYKLGDKLIQNKYSWHGISNLLFLQSPAGVGYSYSLDPKFTYNDATTAKDNLQAVLNFFTKFPQYKKNNFFIAGESYAGKYIPDLAVSIDLNNQYGQGDKINLKRILIGNGVITFKTLQQSTYEFVIDRRFVDPLIVPIYYQFCKVKPQSDGCQFFQDEFEKGTNQLNPYNLYGYCFYNDSFLPNANLKRQKKHQKVYRSQESILQAIKKQLKENKETQLKFNQQNGGAPCAFFDGVFNYFNLNAKQYNSKFPERRWNGPCADGIKYQIDPDGSMNSYKHLFEQKGDRKIGIILYSGTWDSVVPFGDTLKGIQLLGLTEASLNTPWFTDGQHSGFYQLFTNGLISFVTVKGASHQVPQSKRAEAYTLFEGVLKTEKGIFGNKFKKQNQQKVESVI